MSVDLHLSSGLRSLLLRLWQHISIRRRVQFIVVLLLMVMVSFSELLTISAVFPFLMALSSPERVFSHPSIQPLIVFFGIEEPQLLLLYLTLGFGFAALFAGAARVLLLWANTKLSYATGADLGFYIYKRTLFQPYATHVARNSSEVISGVTVKLNQVINNVIGAGLTLISSVIILVAILVALLLLSHIQAILSLAGFGLVYALIIKLTRKRLLSNSSVVAKNLNAVIRSMQEGLGGIRDVLIDGSQDAYCKVYRDADLRMRNAQSTNVFIGVSPRHIIEPIGIIVIISIAYFLVRKEGGVGAALPLLGALALGAQRMLPALQQAYAALALIRGTQASLCDTLALLDQPMPRAVELKSPAPLAFARELQLFQVSFSYAPDSPEVLKNVNLRIAKGERVGFIGVTGCGKSTLLDLVMGLLDPVSGLLTIDGLPVDGRNRRAWQMHIAHVPQTIFLADSTIAENIAFGYRLDNIDMDRVHLMARYAQLSDLIESWPDQYLARVGERGVRLSGGQRQRIGIARALYKQADVIIFDEATSALDGKTEEAVMQAIDDLSQDITVLIIAHRLETLKNCDKIVELRDGQITRICPYSEITS